MIKTKITIPSGIKYISEWGDYDLPKNEHCIVDKGVTGCGYTELALTNYRNVVLCSPRKLLLENKRDQHTQDKNILYLENDIKTFDGQSSVLEFNQKMSDHIFKCQNLGLPIKFMVTYDSLHYVSDYLIKAGFINEFTFVVDEFQSIFLDAFFKSDVEFDFLSYLQDCSSVIFLSATPMLDKYLKDLDEFKDLPFYKLDWSETGFVENIVIQRKQTRSLGHEADKIIDRYLEGNFETLFDINGNLIQSEEAVLYFNSVTDIIRTINRHQIPDPNNPGEKIRLMTPQNTRIICSDTEENRIKLRKIGFSVGKVPLKGEKNPKFMLCTSASYIGVDMYSTCASSFVFADPNIESLALDISLDLPQIVGRQRNRNNPFKNNITIFYKTNKKQMSREDFDYVQNERIKMTNHLLEVFNRCSDEEKVGILKKYKSDIQVSQYSGDFVGISKRTNTPVYNPLIYIANERAWDVSQKDYQDKISVTKALEGINMEIKEYETEEDRVVKDFLDNHFYKTGLFHEKMKMYCDFVDAYKDNQQIMNILLFKISDPSFKKYYDYYGTSGCSARKYQKGELESGFKNITKEDRLNDQISISFKPGDRLTKSYIKEELQRIYDSLGLKKKAKATDLEKYFKLNLTSILQPDKTKKPGFKLE